MATVDYKVSRRGEQWSAARQGEVSMTYVTQEAAFEASRFPPPIGAACPAGNPPFECALTGRSRSGPIPARRQSCLGWR